MTTDQKLDEISKQIVKIKRGSDIQTFFLVVVFVFGITSLADFHSRIKSK
jgi:hypothetical protein